MKKLEKQKKLKKKKVKERKSKRQNSSLDHFAYGGFSFEKKKDWSRLIRTETTTNDNKDKW